MAARFIVTYDRVTPESASEGEFSESGFMQAGGWHYQDAPEGSGNADPMTLHEAVRLVPGCLEDSGRWFTQSDAEQNYRTGESEKRSIHPPRNITPASYRRLARVLRAR